ncbi:hypothetical protein [Paraburkholderia caledonica]|uniref:hypothetical protein n=1 Tax=Paraburkholderia caledonica TaxID=134536 RepID=UPI001FC8ABBD|nr:hypothetical protein [Paraburkholderia caledonica]
MFPYGEISRIALAPSSLRFGAFFSGIDHMDLNLTVAQAKAIFESACAAAEVSVVAQFGEFDIFKNRHCVAYDAALFLVLEEHFGDMTLPELLSIIG